MNVCHHLEHEHCFIWQLLFLIFTCHRNKWYVTRDRSKFVERRRDTSLLDVYFTDYFVVFFQPTHKIQSEGGAPTISLQLVPKLLAPLVSLWVPHAFVVSFKLETDESILISKARDSLNKYKHKVS